MAEVKATRNPTMPNGPMRGRGMPVPKGAIKKGTLSRLLKMMFKYYKWRLILVLFCIVFSSVGSLVSTFYMERLISTVIEPAFKYGFTAEYQQNLIGLIVMMIVVYSLVILANFLYTRTMATVTQGMLYRLRTEMFDKMQSLPIKYFDTHAHGDIMSSYTNDTDATRQLMGQSLPTIITSSLTLIASIAMMIMYSAWLFLVVGVATIVMSFVLKKIGGGSAKYMVAQQTSLAHEEGFMEEMMKGQKVVKVFTHEEKAKEDFDTLNEQLRKDSEKAHIFGNILGPILGNIGNFTYVLIAIVGGILFAVGAPKASLGMALGMEDMAWIGIIVAFLGLSRIFAQTG